MQTQVQQQPTLKQKLAQASDQQKGRKKFLYKLFTLLEQNTYPDIISWSDDGQKVILRNPSLLAEKVLPKLFTHGNYSSFVRQLSFYRFKKVSVQSMDSRVYYHPYFQQGKIELLSRIERVNCVKDQIQEQPKSIQTTNSGAAERLEYERSQYLMRQKVLANQLRMAQDTISRLRSQNFMLQTHLSNKIQNEPEARDLFSYLKTRFCTNEEEGANAQRAMPPQQFQQPAVNRQVPQMVVQANSNVSNHNNNNNNYLLNPSIIENHNNNYLQSNNLPMFNSPSTRSSSVTQNNYVGVESGYSTLPPQDKEDELPLNLIDYRNSLTELPQYDEDAAENSYSFESQQPENWEFESYFSPIGSNFRSN